MSQPEASLRDSPSEGSSQTDAVRSRPAVSVRAVVVETPYGPTSRHPEQEEQDDEEEEKDSWENNSSHIIHNHDDDMLREHEAGPARRPVDRANTNHCFHSPKVTSFLSVKSPITLCFERMLGAGTFDGQTIAILFVVCNAFPRCLSHNYILSLLYFLPADMIATEPRTESVTKYSEVWKHQDATKPRAKRKLLALQADANKKNRDPIMALDKADDKTSGSTSDGEESLLFTDCDKNSSSQPKPTKRSKSDMPSPSDQRKYLDEGNPFLEIEDDLELHRKVVLKMALQRQLHDEERDPDREVSSVIKEGFFWRDYPPCEQVLYDNMADYYEISSLQRQSKLQQAFNNLLVQQVRKTAKESDLKFDNTFTEKKLRDRIRCFYKTHLQNAKKRLATLQKHPYSDEHQTALRVYIRCVKHNLSVEESQRTEPSLRKKYQRHGTVPVELPQASFRVRELLNEARLRL